MSVNPWLVENVHAFSFFNCPECVFKTKTEDIFETHAVSNHPLSCMLFENSIKTIMKEEPMSELELEQIAEESDKTLEELMHSEFGSPEHLDDVQMTLVQSFCNYRTSSYSFLGNYSFWQVGVRQVFKGGNYLEEETIVFLILSAYHTN